MSNVIEVRFGKNKFKAYRNPRGEFAFPCNNVLSYLFQEDMLDVNVSKLEEAMTNGWFSPEDYLAFRAQMGYTLDVFLEHAKKLAVVVTHDDPEGDVNEAQRPDFRCT